MIKQLTRYSLSLLLTLVITYTIGFLVINNKHYIEDPLGIWLYGLLNAVLAVGFFGLIITPFYAIGRRYKITPILTHFIFSSILIIEIISLFYFSITLEPLGSTIFQFSFDQANIILENYFVFRWYYLLLPFPIIIYFLGVKFLPIKKERLFFYALLTIGIFSIFLGLQIKVEKGSFTEVPGNKTIFFVKSIYKSTKPKITNLKPEDISFYQKTTNPNLKNSVYPLYRLNTKENSLGPFFKLKETPPNIVFLVIESLSSSFSGPNADEISYTPFLDSLAQHSLYFDNSLSTAERSFAVLPSTLGSLPHGKHGFTYNISGYPNNETLATWLFENGYTGDFHFGGYARFDYMDVFMNNQGFKNIYDRKEYNYEGTGLKTSYDSIPFGIPDKAFLKSVIEKTNQRKKNVPFLDVYLTLSMHYPYMIEDHEKYYEKVKKTIENSDAEQSIKDKHKKYIAEFATFLYTDDALKSYFNERKKSEDHQNTIYVILGDHMMGEIAATSHIERYRSALMIYSPLLKESKTIKGTNSHLDIAPSFYNLLQEKYNYSAIDSVSWLGQPFDTSATFQSNRDVLFMIHNKNTEEILHKEYFLSKGKLYSVGDRLSLTPIEDKEKNKLLSDLLQISTLLHDEVVTQNLLIPNSSDLIQLAKINKEIHINQDYEYNSLYKVILRKPYQKIVFDLNLKLKGSWNPKNDAEENPLLIYTVKRGDSILSWKALDLSGNAINEERKFNFSIENNLDFKLLQDDEVSVYFWNKQRSEKKFEAYILPLIVKAKL